MTVSSRACSNAAICGRNSWITAPIQRLSTADGSALGDREAIQHPDHVLGPVPSFPGDPAIGREQPDRLAAKIDGDRDQVAHLVSRPALERRGLRRQRRDIGDRQLGKEQRRHPAAACPRRAERCGNGRAPAARRVCRDAREKNIAHGFSDRRPRRPDNAANAQTIALPAVTSPTRSVLRAARSRRHSRMTAAAAIIRSISARLTRKPLSRSEFANRPPHANKTRPE